MVLLSTLAATVFSFPMLALAQEDFSQFPQKSVRLIVTTAAGASSDMLSRSVARKLSEKWGQQDVVENIPGGWGSIGLKQTAEAPGDGYTLVADVSGLAINSNHSTDVCYDPRTDFAGLTQAVTNPQSLVVCYQMS